MDLPHFVISSIMEWKMMALEVWTGFVDKFTSPCVLHTIIIWALCFTILVVLFLSIGFGPAGVVAARNTGSVAAAFQSLVYGAFTPAAGVFATLTSLAMLGCFNPLATLVAALLATVIALPVGNALCS